MVFDILKKLDKEKKQQKSAREDFSQIEKEDNKPLKKGAFNDFLQIAHKLEDFKKIAHQNNAVISYEGISHGTVVPVHEYKYSVTVDKKPVFTASFFEHVVSKYAYTVHDQTNGQDKEITFEKAPVIGETFFNEIADIYYAINHLSKHNQAENISRYKTK